MKRTKEYEADAKRSLLSISLPQEVAYMEGDTEPLR